MLKNKEDIRSTNNAGKEDNCINENEDEFYTKHQMNKDKDMNVETRIRRYFISICCFCGRSENKGPVESCVKNKECVPEVDITSVQSLNSQEMNDLIEEELRNMSGESIKLNN